MSMVSETNMPICAALLVVSNIRPPMIFVAKLCFCFFDNMPVKRLHTKHKVTNGSRRPTEFLESMSWTICDLMPRTRV